MTSPTKVRYVSRSGRAAPASPTLRIAAYARISVADRDGSAFSSIEAQVAALLAYVESQKAQGWILAGDPYVDDGFSGGNSDRPALHRLLRDVEQGLVDVVVVHRFDRFSRSQRDFMNLLHVLESNDVAFVSVTQALDTGTPMGRCMVNVLTAFAQLEREMISERTRDKMRAARRKGLWTGGPVPLGFDLVDRALVVNEDEARRVVRIFELYRDGGSLLTVTGELAERGWRTKEWTTKRGERAGGREFSKTALSALLVNPVYRGLVRSGDKVVPGVHEAIVDEQLWNAVQHRLAEGAPNAQRGRRSRSQALLGGLVECGACGAGMQLQATTKNGRRYSYLACETATKKGAARCPGSRVPLGEMEQWVVEQLRAIGRDPALLAATVKAARAHADDRRAEIDAERAKVVSRRRALSSEQENFVRVIAEDPDAPTVLADRLRAIEAEVEEVDARLANLQADRVGLEDEQVDEHEVQRALAAFTPVWDALWPPERQRVLRLLIERIVFHAASGEAEIRFRATGIRSLAQDPGYDEARA